MVRIFASLFRQFIFWMLFFALNRAVFLIFYSHLVSLEEPGFGTVMGTFWHGLRLDASTASYLLVVPLIFLLMQSVFNHRLFDIANKIYTALAILAYTLITTAEIGTFEEWKTKLHYKALHYLTHPQEVFDSAQTGQFIWLVVIFILVAAFSIFAYNRWFYRGNLRFKRNIWGSLGSLLIFPVFLFVGIRGGIQEIPITQSQSFYCNHNILNLAAVNSGYSFTFSMLDNLRFMDENPYQFYDDDGADRMVDAIRYTPVDTTSSILNVAKPNIVIILLESWSADLIHSLGGEKGITPEFEKLAEKGLLFTRFYASGNRSEQAMSSIFGGFPATPITAITHNLDKVTKLPSLPERLEAEGYHTSFFFGGHLMYGGIKSYLRIAGFDELTEIYDLGDLPQGKLGVHDEYLFDYQINALNDRQQPFFSTIFTLSTHSPYDQPMEPVLDWGGSENQYINSAYYTDHCLAGYFGKASQQPWYDSTLFIIVADHSHNSYRHWPVNSPEYRHIPLLFYGNVLKEEFRGQQLSRLSSQTDLPKTILKQLGSDAEEFVWSRDLMNPYSPEYVFYEATNGVGWMRHKGYFVWHKSYNYLHSDFPEDPKEKEELIREGKSYLQVLFREFISY